MRSALLRHWPVLGVLITFAALAACYPAHKPALVTPQGWAADYRQAWYNADQGSRLMPLAWIRALEQPLAGPPGPAARGAQPPFMDSAYLARFGILPPDPGAKADLPIGFAVDRSDDSAFDRTRLRWYAGQPAKTDWVGLNCAACHTGQMTYQGRTLRIDGAPSLFDFQSFVEALDQALVQTRDSAAGGGERWNRFAEKVLRSDDTPANRALLLASLNRLIDWEAQTEALNHTDLRYGFGRVDAVGHIFNRILLFGGAPQTTHNPSDAPVSYPHLWNITKETKLQWDGIAANAKIDPHFNPFVKEDYLNQVLKFLHLPVRDTPFDYGALGRNTGEVLGVFGEVMIKPRSSPTDLSGFASSVNAVNLNRMEVLLSWLQPPAWRSDLFGAPGDIGLTDASGRKLSPDEVVKAGEALFAVRCADCHTPDRATGRYEHVLTFAQVQPPNVTDEWMACNTWDDLGASGRLTGIRVNYINGEPLPAQAPVRALLETTVKGALFGKKTEIAQTALQTLFGITPPPKVAPSHAHAFVPPKQARLDRCLHNASDPLMAYKARPLEGIWATGPYLHNGSVPTLYDLLLPAAQRPQTFLVGSRAFDPRKVGYATDAASPGNSFTFDTRLPGDSNKGHDYGAGSLSETQRRELLEYLKTL